MTAKIIQKRTSLQTVLPAEGGRGSECFVKKNSKKTGTSSPTILESETGVPGGGRRRKEGHRAA